MFNFLKKPVIEFYCHPDHEGTIPEPYPASYSMPEWFKKLPQTFEETDNFGAPSMTAKKCFPLLDAMSLGYIIPLQGDLYVISNEDRSIVDVRNPPLLKVAEYHSLKQIGGTKGPGAPAPPVKFINNWVVKTRPGWSTLFLPLINNDNNNFTCLGGLVDTDKYPKEVNFPAIWHTPNFDGALKTGTPLVVAIPIKRSDVPKYPVVRSMSKKEFAKIKQIDKVQGIRRSHYTQDLRVDRNAK